MEMATWTIRCRLNGYKRRLGKLSKSLMWAIRKCHKNMWFWQQHLLLASNLHPLPELFCPHLLTFNSCCCSCYMVKAGSNSTVNPKNQNAKPSTSAYVNVHKCSCKLHSHLYPSQKGTGCLKFLSLTHSFDDWNCMPCISMPASCIEQHCFMCIKTIIHVLWFWK